MNTHCPFCHQAHPNCWFDDGFCSKECKEEYNKAREGGGI